LKKLINAPGTEVHEALAGMAAAHPDLIRVHADPAVITRVDAPIRGKVGVISGGGSGHEPLHGGFVGQGMLDAACPGAIFTSPVPDQILFATHAVDGGAGVLYIVKNYTGDVMNFEIAAELAVEADLEVRSVLIDDDVAVEDSLFTAGRRGTGATVLAEKVAGAAAEARWPLHEVQRVAAKANAHSRSMGLALDSCIVPSAGRPTFELGSDEIELGIGIHGEPGRRRIKMLPVAELVELLASAITADLPFQSGDDVLALVNGMGGTPLLELYIVYNELSHVLEKQGLHLRRRLVGNFVTSLEMAGCSVTLMKLDDELLRLWDAPVHTAALRWAL
jgi:dihydroxyacetone kinase-like protein